MGASAVTRHASNRSARSSPSSARPDTEEAGGVAKSPSDATRASSDGSAAAWPNASRSFPVLPKDLRISTKFGPTATTCTNATARARDLRRVMETSESRWPPTMHAWLVAMYFLMEEPSSSIYAKAWSLWMTCFILASLLVYVLETMPDLSHVSEETWFTLEAVCTACFTMEFVGRCLAHSVTDKSMCSFFTRPMNLADLVSLLPFYLMVFGRSLEIASVFTILRAARLIRLTRVFKLGRYSKGMKMMVLAVRKSSHALWALNIFVCIGCILFSSAMYYAEKIACPGTEDLKGTLLGDGSGRTQHEHYVEECFNGASGRWSKTYGLCCDEHDSPLDFPSIIAAFWWCIVTMTTVGFGDIYPRTWQGKVIGSVTTLSGILFIALPIAIVGQKFQEVYNEMNLDSGRTSTPGASFYGRPLAAGDDASAQGDDLSMDEMSRMLRRMRMPTPHLTLLARELAESLTEASTVQQEIMATQAGEAGKQMDAVLNFEILLNKFSDLCEEHDARRDPRVVRENTAGSEDDCVRPLRSLGQDRTPDTPPLETGFWARTLYSPHQTLA